MSLARIWSWCGLGLALRLEAIIWLIAHEGTSVDRGPHRDHPPRIEVSACFNRIKRPGCQGASNSSNAKSRSQKIPTPSFRRAASQISEVTRDFAHKYINSVFLRTVRARIYIELAPPWVDLQALVIFSWSSDVSFDFRFFISHPYVDYPALVPQLLR
jgi:hypothetical protein